MALIKRDLMPRRPPEAGKIKIGMKGPTAKSTKGTSFQPPKKLDHFLVVLPDRGTDGNFLVDTRYHQAIGDDAPTELQGILIGDRPEDILHTEMVVYQGRGSKGKVSSCDGETVTALATGAEKPCALANGGACKCKPYSRFVIQLDHAGAFGFHVFRSTGWTTANNIQTTLEDIFAMFGTCHGCPVRMVAYPSEDNHESGTSTSTKVRLELPVSMREVADRIVDANRTLGTAREQIRLLSAGIQSDLSERDHGDDASEVEEVLAHEEPRAPSGPQAMATGAGEPMGADPDDAKPLPVEDAAGPVVEAEIIEEEEKPAPKKAAKKAAPKPEPEPDEPEEPFDRRNAQRGLFASLNALGIKADPDRKAWAKAQGFPDSTSQWTPEQFEQAIATLLAPVKEEAEKLLKEMEMTLEEVAVEAGIEGDVEYVSHWVQIRDWLQSEPEGQL